MTGGKKKKILRQNVTYRHEKPINIFIMFQLPTAKSGGAGGVILKHIQLAYFHDCLLPFHDHGGGKPAGTGLH